MIKNELEYQVSQEWVQKFEKSIAAIDKDENSKNSDLQRWEMNREALQSHLRALQAEITEYERLVSCDKTQPIQINVESITKLPDALIKARMAAKMSQKELADLLGIEEEKVKEYEKTNYHDAGFGEIIEISAVLGVEFKMAVVQVDFEEIEAGKQSAEKWQKEKASKTVKIP